MPETSTCTTRRATGWTTTSGTCTAGYLNRPPAPENVQINAGYKGYTGSTTLNLTTGAITAYACATLCQTIPDCAFFTWLGPPGASGASKTFNSEGANCWLVDGGATPVDSTLQKGGAWGIGTFCFSS